MLKLTNFISPARSGKSTIANKANTRPPKDNFLHAPLISVITPDALTENSRTSIKKTAGRDS
jgi:hypothetical protein